MIILKNLSTYAINILWGVDVIVNVLLFGRRETISARLGRSRGKNKVYDFACDILDKVDPGHCSEAYESWKKKEV